MYTEFKMYFNVATLLMYAVCYISGIDLSLKSRNQNHFKSVNVGTESGHITYRNKARERDV